MAVDALTKEGALYVARCNGRRFEAANVVVATGFYGKPAVPSFARDLDPRVVQMHSSDYRGPAQLEPGGVLLVGAGNSGADIALELSAGHQVWLSGRDKGEVPIRIGSRKARFILRRVTPFRAPRAGSLRPISKR